MSDVSSSGKKADIAGDPSSDDGVARDASKTFG